MPTASEREEAVAARRKEREKRRAAAKAAHIPPAQDSAALWLGAPSSSKAAPGESPFVNPEQFDASDVDPETVIDNAAWAKSFFGEPTKPSDIMNAYGIDKMCEDVAGGESVLDLAERLGVSRGALIRWLAHPERSLQMQEARRLSAQVYDEVALQTVRDASSIVGVARAREIASHLRWRAKSIAPKEYGDRQQVDIEAKVTMTPEQQSARIAALTERLRNKMGIFAAPPGVDDAVVISESAERNG